MLHWMCTGCLTPGLNLSPPPPPPPRHRWLRSRNPLIGFRVPPPLAVAYSHCILMDDQLRSRAPPVDNREPPPPPSTMANHPPSTTANPPPTVNNRTPRWPRGTGTSNPVMSRRIHTASAFRDLPLYTYFI